MIFYRKNLPVKPMSEKRIVFTDFSGGMSTEVDEYRLPLKQAKLAYNCDGKTGVLKQSLGFDEWKLDGNAVRFLSGQAVGIWHFRRFDKDADRHDDRLMVVSDNFELYSLPVTNPSAGFNKVPGVQFTSVPVAVNYRLNDDDVIIFSSETDDMVIWNGVSPPFFAADAPRISSMAIHFERLFATTSGEKNAVWFSDDLNPTNWNVSSSEAGYIEMTDERGSLNKVVSIFNYVYVFRTFGIARISAYGDQSEFYVSQLFTPSGKIYPDTVTLCGDRILFLCDDGLYAFDGGSVSKILGNLEKLIGGVQNADAHGCYFNGRYFLALKMDFPDERKILCEKQEYCNNAVLEYEIQTGKCTVSRGMDVLCFLPMQTEFMSSLLFLHRGDSRIGVVSDSGKLFEKSLPKCWATPVTDLGQPDKRKHLKQFLILTKRDMVLEVVCDGILYAFNIHGGERTVKTRLDVSGFQFSFNFFTDDIKPFLHSPMLVYACER